MATTPVGQIASVVEAIDKLSGQLAAVAAYLAHVSEMPLNDRDLRSTKGIAQTLAPPAIGDFSKGAPGYHAAQFVDQIASIAQGLEAVRSAGSRTKV